MGRRIYLDTAAATPLDKRVARAMRTYERDHYANPASLHEEGVAAAAELAGARARVANVLGAHPDEIIFTSGGTEGNNLAIAGISGGLITTAIEHASIRSLAQAQATQGREVIYLPVTKEGLVEAASLKEALKPSTRLVSIVYANNEIGTIQPIRELAKVIRHFRTKTYPLVPNAFPYLHIDACQAPRFLDLKVEHLGVDLMTLNSGKIYGPRGVGCLYVRRGVPLAAQLVGGGQEGGLRAGTENVAGIIGFAAALEICAKERAAEAARLAALRDYLIRELLRLPDVQLNGSPDARLPNNVNARFGGVEAELLVLELDAKGVAVSTGSACAIPKHDESYVIMVLQQSASDARSAVRFTLARETKKSDLQYLLKILPGILKKLRAYNHFQ